MSRKLYIPAIYGGIQPPPPAGQGWELNEQESAIVSLMRLHPLQMRATIIVHPLLAEIARLKAKDMAQRNYRDHVSPDGVGPNLMVRRAGYSLPDNYNKADDGNNIESLAWAGDGNPHDNWEGWLNSPPHRQHVLALHSTFEPQVCVGVGFWYEEATLYDYYWCLISCPPA